MTDHTECRHEGMKHLKLFGRELASWGWNTLYTGRGYEQGLGFDITYRTFSVGPFTVLTGIRFEPRAGF